MNVSDWTALILALGGGGGIALVAKAVPLILKSFRHDKQNERSSDDSGVMRQQHVSHPELATAFTSLRAEFLTELSRRIDSTEADCARRVEHLAQRQDEHYKAFAADVKDLEGQVGHLGGLIKGYFDSERRLRR